jgi:hypothetical protein
VTTTLRQPSRIHRAHPALLITELVMPDAEAIETIRELHREAISGGSPPMYLRAALAKPVSADELLPVVGELPNNVADLLQ